MNVLLSTITAALMAAILYFVYGFDDWLGLLAFKPQYFAFCLVVSAIVGATWLGKSRRAAGIACLASLLLLVSPYFLGTPSPRILREVLLNAPVGTEGNKIEGLVAAAYHESGYVMPRIKRDDRRIHVSLTTQAAGDCTAAIFYLSDGVVVNSEFSAD